MVIKKYSCDTDKSFRRRELIKFEPGKLIVVKIIDDRGIKFLRVIGVD